MRRRRTRRFNVGRVLALNNLHALTMIWRQYTMMNRHEHRPWQQGH